MVRVVAGDTRYALVMPSTWSLNGGQRWEQYVCQRLSPRQAPTATRIAQYGRALMRRYEIDGAPRTGADVDRAAPETGSVQVLSRSEWDPEAGALACGSDSIRHRPEFLLATHVDTSFSRADNFRIFASVALFADGTASPIAVRRSYGDYDHRADDTIARLVNATTHAAKICKCAAPVTVLDYDLSDDIIHKLAGDDYPFVAAVEAHWWHSEIAALVVPARLLGSSPLELFTQRGAHIYRYEPTLAEASTAAPVEVIPMQYRGQPDSGLYYVLVPGAPIPYFVVRPSRTDNDGVHQQMPSAANMAERAAALHGVSPLAALQLECFRASSGEEQRWLRHMAIVHAVITFTVTRYQPARQPLP